MQKEENPGKMTTGSQNREDQPKMFTKEQVNGLMQKRIERSHQAFFNRYGVKDLNDLDDLFGRSKSVDGLNQQIEELTQNHNDLQSKYDELVNQSKDLTKKYAFSSRNIKPELYNDIEMYFKGKELEINENTLDEELKTHAGWCNTGATDLGVEAHEVNKPDEKEIASKYFGVEL